MVWVVVMTHGELTLRIHGLSNITNLQRAASAAFFMLMTLKNLNFVHKSVYNLFKSCHLAVSLEKFSGLHSQPTELITH